MATKTIASYRYFLDILPTSKAYFGRTAQIVLYDASNQYAGVINFLKITTTMPPTKETPTYNIYFQHSAHFADFIDMLRHETPLYLFDDGVLGTSQSEPVGEGE
jgi:hypothetical protein